MGGRAGREGCLQRTISIALDLNSEQSSALKELLYAFSDACNKIVPIAIEKRCWNRKALHDYCYYLIRGTTNLGAQMTCNAIGSVCYAYQALKINKNQPVPMINFKPDSSAHYDKRTYAIRDEIVSLYTLSGRIRVPMILGEFQRSYLARGTTKEAELVLRKDDRFFLNLVIDLKKPESLPPDGDVMGSDMGENNLSTLSTGKLFRGGKIRHKRGCHLALRKRLQSNGSKSAKQLLRKISGKERRHVTHVNHVISKKIVEEAKGCSYIALEKLTNIRNGVRGSKAMRRRLHSWAWKQLQEFIQYKAEAEGITVIFVNPAYTSQLCATCGQLGSRQRHRFECKFCGIRRHSDINASLNIRRIAMSADIATGNVSCPNVAAKC